MHAQSSTAPLTHEANALLLETLPTLAKVGGYYSRVYSWSRRLEADDLTQIACLAVAEALAKGLHVDGNMIGYLVVIGKRAVQRHIGVFQSLIKTPRTRTGFQPVLIVVSLDAPLSADSDETLLDVLADDYNASYDCYLDSLPF